MRISAGSPVPRTAQNSRLHLQPARRQTHADWEIGSCAVVQTVLLGCLEPDVNAQLARAEAGVKSRKDYSACRALSSP